MSTIVYNNIDLSCVIVCTVIQIQKIYEVYISTDSVICTTVYTCAGSVIRTNVYIVASLVICTNVYNSTSSVVSFIVYSGPSSVICTTVYTRKYSVKCTTVYTSTVSLMCIPAYKSTRFRNVYCCIQWCPLRNMYYRVHSYVFTYVVTLYNCGISAV